MIFLGLDTYWVYFLLLLRGVQTWRQSGKSLEIVL